MVGFQHNGGHVQFSLKPELTDKVRAMVDDIETAIECPEDVAALCWPCCCDQDAITEEEFEAALVAAPSRAGVMLIGLLENVKGIDKAVLHAATRAVDTAQK